MAEKKTHNLSIRIPIEEYEPLKKYAVATGSGVSTIVRQVMNEYLDLTEPPALNEDYTAGELHSHGVRMTDNMWNDLNAYAESRAQTTSDIIRLAVIEYMQNHS